ncbi:MAG: hypothetical protein GEV12_09325 [Micromonosporaceae bacterium]|nr:hypothetical protein [Micromonosporaceae bacterium]
MAGLRQRRQAPATGGFAPGLLVPAGAPGWTPASALLAGGFLDELLVAAKQRWNAPPPAAAALAWRSYTYWLALPAVLGWATNRRVPLLTPDDVLVQITHRRDQPLVTIGLRRLRLAAGPEPDLLRQLRASLRDAHLDPLLAQLQTRVNLGTRTLLGSLASAVAYGAVRGVEAPPAEIIATAGTLLSALGVSELVHLEPGPDGVAVQRRTCCLAFTLPEPKVCSGCCLRFPR